METIIYVLAGIAIGYVLGRIFTDKSEKKVSGERAQLKEVNLDKILASFGRDEEITNDRVELLLGVSDSTATRYLDELEQQGSLVQVGKTGQNVIYKKV